MIKDRLITAIKARGMTNPELEKATGISRYTWQNIRNKAEREIKEVEISAVLKLIPEYAYWIATGNVMPEAGQTSPEYDEANKNLGQQQKA